MDKIDRPLGQALPDTDRDDTIEPRIAGIGRREARHYPEIIRRRIDDLTAEPGHHLGRPVAQSDIGHRDQRAILRLQHDAAIEFNRAVAAHDLPIGSARQHNPAQAFAFECAAGNDADPALNIFRPSNRQKTSDR